MQSFILSGSTNAGYRHVRRDDLMVLPDGVLARSDQQDVFITSATQRGMFAKGLSIAQPGWEQLLNDYITLYVTSGVASDALALDLFVLLGQEERRATLSGDPVASTRQRVREGALGFDLLATASTWRPTIAAALPYWNRDWVAWCDKFIAAAENFRAGLEKNGSHLEARRIEVAAAPLSMLRSAFSSASFPAAAATRRGACYIATHVYGDYDAPEVIVLRRWRDVTLCRTPAGRVGVAAYYAVSPWLVRTFGDQRLLRRPALWLLGRLVRHLDAHR